MTDVDYADDLVLISDFLTDGTILLHKLEQAASEVGLYINAKKTEFICYNQHHTGSIKSLKSNNIKAVEEFTYLGSNIASTNRDVQIRLGKAWSALNKLNSIWKSSLAKNLKINFFRATVESVLVYGSTSWTLTESLEKTLDGAYTRMLRAVHNISWKQHPTKKQLYGHLPPISVAIRDKRLRFAGHCYRNKDELASELVLWRPLHGNRTCGRPSKTYVDQLADDNGCEIEDLQTLMVDRDRWKDNVNTCRARSTR